MLCEEVQRWISPYLDSELDPHTNLEIVQHLESCTECQRVFEKERNLEASLAASFTTDPYTQTLWNRALHRAVGARHIWMPRRWQLAVATLGTFLILLGSWYGMNRVRYDLVYAAANNHQLYVKNQMMLDVQSSSPEIIEAFFKEKLPFHVQCPRDMASKGIQLIGARLCHLKRIPVAYLLYHVEDRPVSVFLLDEQSATQFHQQAHTFGTPNELSSFRLGQASVVTMRIPRGVICAVGDVPRLNLEKLVLAHAPESV